MSDFANVPAPCIVCGVTPEPVEPGSNQPYAATEFQTFGHYGSTVFDPMDSDEALTINVCDACLSERSSRVVKRERVEIPRDFYEYRAWVAYTASEDVTS